MKIGLLFINNVFYVLTPSDTQKKSVVWIDQTTD